MKERRKTAQEEEASNRSGMNPKPRDREGKYYWRLLHNTSSKTNYVKMLMVKL